MATSVETDDRSRVVLPGHPNTRFIVRENADGSILLQPARMVTEAQHEYDSDPDLRELLDRATASPTVHRQRAQNSVTARGDYSAVADAQLDALESGPDLDLYNAVLDICELIFRMPAQAQAFSTAITTTHGIPMRLPVPGHPPYKVFWSTEGPRVEAVFPHP